MSLSVVKEFAELSCKISIVVPVRNEADNIVPLIEEIVNAMSYATAYDIIVVDDGSNDQTAQILTQLLQHIDSLRVIQHELSYGQSTAIYTGIKAARYPPLLPLWMVTDKTIQLIFPVCMTF